MSSNFSRLEFPVVRAVTGRDTDCGRSRLTRRISLYPGPSTAAGGEPGAERLDCAVVALDLQLTLDRVLEFLGIILGNRAPELGLDLRDEIGRNQRVARRHLGDLDHEKARVLWISGHLALAHTEREQHLECRRNRALRRRDLDSPRADRPSVRDCHANAL